VEEELSMMDDLRKVEPFMHTAGRTFGLFKIIAAMDRRHTWHTLPGIDSVDAAGKYPISVQRPWRPWPRLIVNLQEEMVTKMCS
jgi:hypothetical protein